MSEKKTKLLKQEALDKIDEICIETIGEEYRAKMESDDGGNHLVVYFEGTCPPLAKKYFQTGSSFHGWDIIIKIVPEGYLEVFHPLKKKDDFEEIKDW